MSMKPITGGWHVESANRLPKIREDAPVLPVYINGKNMWPLVWIHDSWRVT